MENDPQKENKPQIEEEINFLNVIKTPRRWFGLVYPYFFTIFLIGGYYFADQMGIATQNTVSPTLVDTANVFNDVKATKGGSSQGVDLKLAQKPNEAFINQGKTVFQNACSSCHGPNGEGNGPASVALNPKPRNFHSNQGWVNGRKITDMFKTVQNGIPGTGMASFNYLPNADKLAVIDYIRTFANDFPPITDQEMADLDKQYSLSKGSQTAAQIPVAQATQMLTENALPRMQNVYSAISYINNNPDDPGSKLFDRVVSNRVRALTFLSESGSWTNSVQDFVKTVTSSLNVNGFNASVINLSGSDWNVLFNYVKKLNVTTG